MKLHTTTSRGLAQLQLPQNDTIPQGVGCHKTLIHVTVFREFYFDWHHSGFCNDNKDRLHSEMIITKGFKLLEIIDCIK